MDRHFVKQWALNTARIFGFVVGICLLCLLVVIVGSYIILLALTLFQSYPLILMSICLFLVCGFYGLLFTLSE